MASLSFHLLLRFNLVDWGQEIQSFRCRRWRWCPGSTRSPWFVFPMFFGDYFSWVLARWFAVPTWVLGPLYIFNGGFFRRIACQTILPGLPASFRRTFRRVSFHRWLPMFLPLLLITIWWQRVWSSCMYEINLKIFYFFLFLVIFKRWHLIHIKFKLQYL